MCIFIKNLINDIKIEGHSKFFVTKKWHQRFHRFTFPFLLAKFFLSGCQNVTLTQAKCIWIWKSNFDKKFEGIEECLRAFPIIS